MSSFEGTEQKVNQSEFSVRQTLLSLEEATAISTFEDCVELYNKWRALPGDVPYHREITPAFLGARILPEMYIIDVVKGPLEDELDFRWRLFGTAHGERYGTEATGILMSEAAKRDKSAAGSFRIAKQVYRSLKPAFFLTEFIENGILRRTTCTVVMPLSNKAGDITRLFGCSKWQTKD